MFLCFSSPLAVKKPRLKARRSLRPELGIIEPLEARALLSPRPVNPNHGFVCVSQFQPWGYGLFGSQFMGVSAGKGAAFRYVVTSKPRPHSVPISYHYPKAAVNSGAIKESQFNAGGFGEIGTQLENTRILGGLIIDAVDAGGGGKAASGNRGVTSQIGPIRRPAAVPAGTPNQVVNSGVVNSSQFNDGGFGTIGIQARNVSIGGDLAIVRRTTNVPTGPTGRINTPAWPTQAVPYMTANQGSIISSQFNDGGFGDIGLQWQGVNVGGSVEVGLERTVVSPKPAASPGALVQFSGSYAKAATMVKLNIANPGQVPNSKQALTWAVQQLYPGMYAYGPGIQPKTRIVSVDQNNVVRLSQPTTTAAKAAPVFFFMNDSATNTGQVVTSQFADGGFGDIGMQWSGVTVAGRVATRTNDLEIQPERNAGGIVQSGLSFGLLQPAKMAEVGSAFQATPSLPLDGPTAAVPPSGGTPSTNDATNSGRIVGSQFADGGFGDIGLQWRNVKVAGNVETAHNAVSIQPDNQVQGPISVNSVTFAGVARAFAGSPMLPGLPGSTDPALTNNGTLFTPTLPTPTNPGPTGFQINAATNSGLISDSQFADGGFGDIGLQWSDVVVKGRVEIVHNSLSIQPEGGKLAGVSVANIQFGAPVFPVDRAVKGPLAPATLASLVVSSTPANPGPGFVPDPMFQEYQNTADQNNQQILSGAASAATFQWNSRSFVGGQLTVVNNVLTVVNSTSNASTITLANVTFPGAIPPYYVPTSSAQSPNTVIHAAAASKTDAATNSGSVWNNQFVDGGMGDIGLQWRGVTIDGAVSIYHNSLSINATGNANGEDSSLGPIVVSGITFNSGLNAASPASAGIFVTPPEIDQRTSGLSAALSGSGIVQAASNSATLWDGQFLDGGMGAVGLQWQNVTIHCPVTIVNNVMSIVVSSGSSQGVTISDVRFA